MNKVSEEDRINRLGETRFNNNGSKMTIIEYNSYRNILVKFKQGKPIRTNYRDFKIGVVKSPYDKSVFNIGYFGEGSYKARLNYKVTSQYNGWRAMLERCYDPKCQEKHPSYEDCYVCEEWLNFQTFAKWYDNNYYKIDGEKMCLDKDILIKGNKIYSPDTCIFVPQRINLLFIKTNAKRGKYPIGVSWNKINKKFEVKCNNLGKGIIGLGNYSNIEDAFLAYKIYKDKYIKEVAEEYKSKIPKKLYDAMIDYIVEITD